MTDSSSSSSSSSDCDNGAFMKPVAPLILKDVPQAKKLRKVRAKETAPRCDSSSWRWGDDGTYNNGPTDPEYFKKYYHLKIACPVKCELCGRVVGQQKIKRHQATKMCANGRLGATLTL